MAYVVPRPNGRFEIRESFHTPKGPRSRSLANFRLLTQEVMAVARGRALRPFDAVAVLGAADRAGAPVAVATGGSEASSGMSVSSTESERRRQFVESSRRMVVSVERSRPGNRRDPGEVLIDLLGFAEQITRYRAAPVPEPLRFPPLARLMAEQRTGAGEPQ